MNGRNEKEQLNLEALDVLTGLEVSVVGGTIVGDTYSKPLSKDGAQTVLDRLRARGFQITRTP